MPRRASSGVNVGQMIGIAAAIVGFFVIAAVLIFLIAGDLFGGGGGNSSSRGEPINVSNYLENANSLRGNQYRVEGTIQEMLKHTDDGRLISFEANDGTTSSPIPILVPGEIKNVNLERGSEMSMDVEVGRDGTLKVLAINN